MTTIQDIPGWEGLYAATTDGRIWSHPKRVQVGNRQAFHDRPGHWLTPTRYSNRVKHLRVYLSRNGRKQPVMVHRLVAQTFLPNLEGLPVVNHLDGDPMNNAVTNLEWTTHSANCEHAVRTGLTVLPDQRGAANSNASLTAEMVLTMRKRKAGGERVAAIARDLGIRYKTAHDAITGKTWTHL